jgi:6-phosphogluconolactonase
MWNMQRQGMPCLYDINMNMKNSVRIFAGPAEVASRLAEEIIRRIKASASSENPFSIALSGGSTPEKLYSFLGDELSVSVPWEFVYLFWSDERCVHPGHPESNYGMAKRLLIDKSGIPEQNVFRMKGENEPSTEAVRYASQMSSVLRRRNGVPVFDLVILGMGDDGHTASIFPGQHELFPTDKICAVSTNPAGQKRITLTDVIINNAEAVVFLVTGKKKAWIVRAIIENLPGSISYPAARIKPVFGSLDWYLDKEAGELLHL